VLSTPQQTPHGPDSAVRMIGETAAAPLYPLYDANAVSLATLFGNPLAGACLMFVNDRRLGRAMRGWLTLLCAAVVTAVVISVGWNFSPGVSLGITVVLVLAMREIARALQGRAVAAHVAQGGRLGSKWTAFWVGFVFLMATVAAVFVLLFMPAYKHEGPKVIVGSKDDVFYTGTAARSEALALGNDLKTDGYFLDKGETVVLDKGANGTVISFVVKEGSWNDASTMDSFEEIARQVAPDVGGLPVKVQLLNKKRVVERESQVAIAEFEGGDRVYSMGIVTAAEAQALGNALKEQGFFEGNGADVFLTKHSDGTTLAFVVGDGVWDDTKAVASFEQIVRAAAPTVGGLPVRLKLESTGLDVKKDELLK